MIYIKTDMKVMPKGCTRCKEECSKYHIKFEELEKSKGDRYDELLKDLGIALKVRPDWCPLVKKEDMK